MTNYFIIPGIGNSGENHWQTYFENSGDNFHRINQQDWDTPDCTDWIEKIDATLIKYDLNNVVLIGHSLGCIAIAFWAKQYKRKIKGALLVAPSDTEATQYIFATTGFMPLPQNKINFKTILVTSSNDHWILLERAELLAKNWNSELINIGEAGHINAASGHHNWQQGLQILEKLD